MLKKKIVWFNTILGNKKWSCSLLRIAYLSELPQLGIHPIYFVHVSLFKIFPTDDRFPASDLGDSPKGFHCFLSPSLPTCKSLFQREKKKEHFTPLCFTIKLPPTLLPLQPRLSLPEVGDILGRPACSLPGQCEQVPMSGIPGKSQQRAE